MRNSGNVDVPAAAEQKSKLDLQSLYQIAYVYYDLSIQDKEQGKDAFQQKVDVIRVKLSEWTDQDDEILNLMRQCWRNFIRERDKDFERYKNNIKEYLSNVMDRMSHGQRLFVISDLNDISKSSGTPHDAEIYMIRGVAEMLGVSLQDDPHAIVVKTSKDSPDAKKSEDMPVENTKSTETVTQDDEPYRKKVREALADGVVTNIERAGLDFFQKKLKLSDNDALRIFDEVIAEIPKEAEEKTIKPFTSDVKKKVSKASTPVRTDGEGEEGDTLKKKRITYSTWDEFEKGQGEDPRKKRFMPIARKIRELVIEALEEQSLPYEVRYGGGTFSFSVPRDNAKSGKRTFSRFGLLDHKLSRAYFDSLYMAEGESLPERAQFMSDGSSRCSYDLASLEDFEKVKQDIKKGVMKSYKMLTG